MLAIVVHDFGFLAFIPLVILGAAIVLWQNRKDKTNGPPPPGSP